jgi:hypothetical protein
MFLSWRGSVWGPCQCPCLHGNVTGARLRRTPLLNATKRVHHFEMAVGLFAIAAWAATFGYSFTECHELVRVAAVAAVTRQNGPAFLLKLDNSREPSGEGIESGGIE